MSAENEQPTAFKPKKSVALSGVVAGNTALCSVGKSGNDLHYRGYDISDLAGAAERAERISALVPLTEGAHFMRQRRAIRNALAADGIAATIDAFVARLLNG